MPCTVSFMGMKVQDNQRVKKQHMLSRVDGSLSSVEGTKWGQMQILCFQVISYYWNFSFNISPSNEHSGLISFRMDWLDFLAVQGTLKSLLQSAQFSRV